MHPSLETPLMHIALRSVQPADESFLFEVYASTRTEELAQVDWSEEQRENFLQMQFQAQAKHYRENYPGAEFNVVLADGAPVGRLFVHHRTTEIRIMDIALLPAYRRRGIGTVLLEEILAEGARTGKVVSIHVEAFNPALHWYERLGFRQISAHGPYHLMQWVAGASATHGRCENLTAITA